LQDGRANLVGGDPVERFAAPAGGEESLAAGDNTLGAEAGLDLVLEADLLVGQVVEVLDELLELAAVLLLA
jgi:hypothetical protein